MDPFNIIQLSSWLEDVHGFEPERMEIESPICFTAYCLLPVDG